MGVNLDFVRVGFTHRHRCHAFPCALAGLFLYTTGFVFIQFSVIFVDVK